MKIKALNPITEDQFYQYWQHSKASGLTMQDEVIAYFYNCIESIPKTALGKYYWQIFENGNPQPRILSVSGALSSLTPYIRAEEMIGLSPQDIFQCFHPEDLQQTLTFVAKYFSMLLLLPKEKRSYLNATIYTRVRNAENKYIWVALEYPVLLFSDDNNLMYGMALYSDVSHIVNNFSSPMLTVLDTLDKQNHVFQCYYPKSTQQIIHHFPRITPREKDIVSLLAQGRSSKEIASILNITKSTVDNHRQRLLKKFNVTSSVELICKTLGL